MGQLPVQARNRSVTVTTLLIPFWLLSFVPCLFLSSSTFCSTFSRATISEGDPERLVFIEIDRGKWGRHGRMRLWTSKWQLQEFPLPYEAYEFCFSPDGRKMAFVGARKPSQWASSELMILNMQTRSVRQITKGFRGALDASIAWRPLGRSIALGRTAYSDTPEDEKGDGGLWLVNSSTGKMRQLIHGSDADVSVNLRPQFSNDGSMLACLRGWEHPAVFSVGNPDKWYILDSSHLSPASLMCLTWVDGNRKLALGATSVNRTAFSGARYQVARGPGGVWEWDLTRGCELLPAGEFQNRKEDIPINAERTRGASTQARLLVAGGESVYALCASPDGSKIVFCSDSGIWIWNRKRQCRSKIAGVEQLPELKEMRGTDSEYNLPVPYVDVGWSYRGRLVYVRVSADGGDRLRIIDVAAKRIAFSYLSQGGRIVALWQPISR